MSNEAEPEPDDNNASEIYEGVSNYCIPESFWEPVELVAVGSKIDVCEIVQLNLDPDPESNCPESNCDLLGMLRWKS